MITVSQDSGSPFPSLQAAVDAASPGETLLIRPGLYRERVVLHRPGLHLVGEDPETTILTASACARDRHPDGTEKTTFLSATLMTAARDITVENLTIRNDAGDGRLVGQAVAVYAAGDRGLWRNCRFIAHQDTLYLGPLRDPDVLSDIAPRTGDAERFPLVQNGPLTHSRQAFLGCTLQGDVDFIFGCYRAWFENCVLFMNARGGYYTAANTHPDQPFGFVFRRCRLTGACPPGEGFLGRPWRGGAATVFLACDMDDCVSPQGFADWDETRPVTPRLGEWGTTGARADQSSRHPAQKRLTEAEASRITPSAVLSFGDGWLPAGLFEDIPR